ERARPVIRRRPQLVTDSEVPGRAVDAVTQLAAVGDDRVVFDQATGAGAVEVDTVLGVVGAHVEGPHRVVMHRSPVAVHQGDPVSVGRVDHDVVVYLQAGEGAGRVDVLDLDGAAG